MSPPITEQAIASLLARCNYKYKDLAKRDIQQAVAYFKELDIKVDKYVYPNGQVRDLVTLDGTIPVNYKNNRYNIPVQLFLSDTHPYTPPLCYVRPTADMSVNVSDHVDANGRINLPCLREWAYPQSDIYMLLTLMAMKFSEQSPVFAKRTNQASTTPYPVANSVRPTYPGYPSSSGQTPYPSANNASYSMPTPYGQPTYPSMSSANPPYPTGPSVNPPYPNNPYYPMAQTSQLSEQKLSHLKSGSGSNIGTVRPLSGAASAATPYPLSTQSSYSGDTIKPEHFKMSLVSAVHEKACDRFFELTSVKQAEIDSLNRVNAELEESQRHLESFSSEVENEILNLNNMTIELNDKTSQLNESINQMQHRDSASIEDAVVTPAPLYRQLMQLFAEELAIQDLIYYLSEGLQNRTVNLPDFLKQVRFLSRKQFMLRATMQRAREKAALPL